MPAWFLLVLICVGYLIVYYVGYWNGSQDVLDAVREAIDEQDPE